MGGIQPFLPYLAFLVIVLVGVYFIFQAMRAKAEPAELDWRDKIKDWSEKKIERQLKELLEMGEFRVAADIAFYLERWQEASEYYVKGKHLLGAAKSFLRQGKLKEAAKIYQDLDDFPKAAALYAQSNDFASAGQMHYLQGDLKKAAELFEQAGNKKRAAEIYYRAGLFRKAAGLYEDVSEFKSAADSLVKALENVEQKLGGEIVPHEMSFYRNLARSAAEVFKKAQNAEQAILLLDRAKLFEESARMLEELGRLKESAERYKKAGMLLKSAECLEKLGESSQAGNLRAEYYLSQGKKHEAITELEKAGDWERVAGICRELGDLKKSARCLEKAGKFKDAGEIWEQLENWQEAGEDFEKAGEFSKAGVCFEKAGEQTKASEMFEKAGAHFRAGLSFYQRGLLDRAIASLQQVDKTSEDYRKACSLLGKIFQEKGMLNLARESLRLATENQEMSRSNLEDFYQLAVLNERLGDFEEGMAIYEKILLINLDYQDARIRLERLRQQKTVIESRSPSSATPSLEATQSLREAEPLGMEKPVRYEIIEEIGRGGMGIVYKARDTILDRIVAYKVLPANLKDHPAALRNFFREAKSAARLNHPNIVTVYDAGEEAGNYYIAMEYVEGETVKQILVREGKIPLKAVLLIAGQVCRALEYAHERKVVHRDIKSSNVMWTKDRQTKLMDFGLAKVLEEVKGYQTIASGTPYYMSPEQAMGKEIDHRTDIYSLGVTMFEMITGQLPFKSGDAVYHHIHTPPPEAKSIDQSVNPELSEIIFRCMQKDPGARFQSAKELLEALKKVKVE